MQECFANIIKTFHPNNFKCHKFKVLVYFFYQKITFVNYLFTQKNIHYAMF